MTKTVAVGGVPTSLRRASVAAVDARGTLLDVFARTVEVAGPRIAIDAPDQQLSYSELDAEVSRLAERLRATGIGPGDRVGVYVPSGTAALYIAILGVLHAGAAYVPVDADDSPTRAGSVWDAAGVCAVLSGGLELALLGMPRGGSAAPTPEDDAWIIFTSGSSGQPKGVAVSHRAAAAFVSAERQLFDVRRQDRVLAGLSVSFDASCEEMWLAWAHGAALVPAPRALMRAAADLGPWLAERRVSVISTVPTLAAMWDERDLAGVRLVIVGGEACPEALAWRLAEHREVWNTYGPTEATVVTTAARLEPGRPVTIGWPLVGWQVAVVDEHGETVDFGEAGELVIAGVGLGRYIDADLDRERYGPLPALGWARAYRTGDIVYETADGLAFVGRRDEQIKLGGRRLELGEVDAHLRSLPGVVAAAAAVQSTVSGGKLLVGYVVGEIDHDDAQAALMERLPNGVTPLIVELDALPMSSAGKVDRRALPWPPPSPRAAAGDASELSGIAAWLAERWAEELGPFPMTAGSDFFALGGSSLAAARLVSRLRTRYPSLAVADVYAHRRLGELAAHLEQLAEAEAPESFEVEPATRRWGLLQVAGAFVVIACQAPQWLAVLLAFDRLQGSGPQVAWPLIVVAFLLFATPFGRSALAVTARRLLLADLRPGRYRRHSWLMLRIWLVERLAAAFRSEALAGTPFAAHVARMAGHDVGAGARLGTIPPLTGLVTIGAGATVEAQVDMHGWWIEGQELVVGEVHVGEGARVGSRAMLGPGANVGSGAEIEPGTVVAGPVPPGERWAGSPGRRVGRAGESWPTSPPPPAAHAARWKAMYVVGLVAKALLPLLAAAPGFAWFCLSGSADDVGLTARLLVAAPVLAGSFIVLYALLVAATVRGTGRLVTPGLHAGAGRVGWALWFSGAVMETARGALFSLFASLYTRPWLRLLGVPVAPGAEVCIITGVSRLTRFGEGAFAADDVCLATARSHHGWLEVAPIEVGARTFVGNGAILAGGSRIGSDGLVGVQTVAPLETPAGTAWFGDPAIEFPRVADAVDLRRTFLPPRRLKVARGTVDLVRILLPPTVSLLLSLLVVQAFDAVASRAGILGMALLSPAILACAGLVAGAVTVVVKWLVIGRYRSGEHPLWSFFVWRDEVMNSLQEQLAGAWLLGAIMGTPLMSFYLRAMGARIGRDAWIESLNITEFDMVSIGDGAVVNRDAVLETHLFHDRLMRIGTTELGAGCSIGPESAVLPDTVIGARTVIGPRSVVLRGEALPPRTRWQGAPVASTARP